MGSFLVEFISTNFPLAVTISIVVILLLIWLTNEPSRGPNPFAFDNRKPVEEYVSNLAERDAVLKQGFSAKKVPQDLDAIIVGSGIGGLSAAALLALSGKRCLVLEQHDQSGGCCHTFIEDGFEFDVGIHYIGDMQHQTVSKCFIDQITRGQLQWGRCDDAFDVCLIGDGDKTRQINILAGRNEFRDELLKEFPEEEAGIDKFLQLIKEARKITMAMAVMKMVPKWLVSLLYTIGVVDLLSPFTKFTTMTVQEAIDSCTNNEILKAVMCYNFGDYGTPPGRAPASMQAVLMQHFMHGGSYPRGGASQIAFHITRTIEEVHSTCLPFFS